MLSKIFRKVSAVPTTINLLRKVGAETCVSTNFTTSAQPQIFGKERKSPPSESEGGHFRNDFRPVYPESNSLSIDPQWKRFQRKWFYHL